MKTLHEDTRICELVDRLLEGVDVAGANAHNGEADEGRINAENRDRGLQIALNMAYILYIVKPFPAMLQSPRVLRDGQPSRGFDSHFRPPILHPCASTNVGHRPEPRRIFYGSANPPPLGPRPARRRRERSSSPRRPVHCRRVDCGARRDVVREDRRACALEWEKEKRNNNLLEE
jgi:hypothetical protein